MKKVVLIGDSTRMGYDKFIKESLEGVAEVYYAPENARFSTNTLRFAHDWKTKGGWPSDIDLVLWNVGLWDLLEMFGEGPLVPVEHYKYNIPRIDKRLRTLFPEAKMVFVTSVSVLEERYKPGDKYIRRNSAIEEYNKEALDALKETDTKIFDLYTLTKDAPASYRTDAVHFYTDEGRAFVGGLVLDFITAELGISAEEIKAAAGERENYSVDNVGF
jgi:hypothetical protein